VTLREFREITKDVPDDFELVDANSNLVDDADVDEEDSTITFYTEED